MTSPHLIPTLTALLDRWEKRVALSAQIIETIPQPIQAAYFVGMMDGLASAREELAAALASAMSEVTKGEKL